MTLTLQQLDAGLQQLVLAPANSGTCSSVSLPNTTVENRSVSCISVTRAPTATRIRVLFIGGQRGCSKITQDALLSLLQRLLAADAGAVDLVIPQWEDNERSSPGAQLIYPAASVAIATVRRIISRLELIVVPCVNPDGRAFIDTPDGGPLWMKNRRPPPAGAGPCTGARVHPLNNFGVDLDRNYPIAWDFDKYFSSAAASRVQASKQPCDDHYIGPSAGSEPEVRNVMWLLGQAKQIDYFVDVAMYGRNILYPWAMDDNQELDDQKTYSNTNWDRHRDGPRAGLYGEYIPSSAWQRHREVGDLMVERIRDGAGTNALANQESIYDLRPSGRGLFPATGTASDYAFAARADGSVTSFTIEFGGPAVRLGVTPIPLGESGFITGDGVYPKIEREVHLALLKLLDYASR